MLDVLSGTLTMVEVNSRYLIELELPSRTLFIKEVSKRYVLVP